MEMKNLEDGRM